MDGYTMIASGIGIGIIVLILAVKVYDRFLNGRESAVTEDLATKRHRTP